MKKAIACLLVMLLLGSTALALSAEMENEVLRLREALNGNLSAGGYSGADTFNMMQVGEAYYILTSGDGRTVMFLFPDEYGDSISSVVVFCDSVSGFQAVMEDVQYLAYWFGSRDSIESVTAWTEQWYGALCQAWYDEAAMTTDICDTPALQAQASIIFNEGAPVLTVQVDAY